MRLLLRWSLDLPEVGLELHARGVNARPHAGSLPASLRLGLLLAERGALTAVERRRLIEALLAEPSVVELCRALPGPLHSLLEIRSAAGSGERRVARHLAHWDGSSWRVGRAVSAMGAPGALGVTAWSNAPPGLRSAAALLVLCVAALLVLTPPWWRWVERTPLLWSLRLVPATSLRPPPTLGVLLVPPDRGARRYDRAPLARAATACLDAGAPWIAVDVPMNRDAPSASELWRSLAAAEERALLGVDVGDGPDEPTQPFATDAVSALALPWSGYGGGAALGMDVNLQTTLSSPRAGLEAGACLPTLGWTMAERLALKGTELQPAFSAPGPDGFPVGWLPLVVPARALEITSKDLIITSFEESGWQGACDPDRVSGVVLAYASWEEDPTFDRLDLRIAGRPEAALLPGVELHTHAAVVPGPYAQALLAQALTVGPGLVPWPHALSAWLGRPDRISPCGGSAVEVRAIPTRDALAVAGTALLLAAMGSITRGLLSRAKAPGALLQRATFGAGAWLTFGGVCVALTRVYPPVVAGLCVLGLEAIRGVLALSERQGGQDR